MSGAPLDCPDSLNIYIREKWRLKIIKNNETVDLSAKQGDCDNSGNETFGALVALRLQLQISVLMLLSTVQFYESSSIVSF